MPFEGEEGCRTLVRLESDDRLAQNDPCIPEDLNRMQLDPRRHHAVITTAEIHDLAPGFPFGSFRTSVRPQNDDAMMLLLNLY